MKAERGNQPRGVLIVRDPRRAAHTCEPPLLDRVLLKPDGHPGHTERVAPPLSSTWDCPECGRVWVVRKNWDTNFQRYWDPHWVRADWWTAHRHRRRAREQA